VIVPTEKVVEMRRGRKVDAERKFFPGYVLVKMDLTDEAFHLIKNTPKVTGFLGSGDKPMPISEKEAMAILQQVQEGVEHPKPSVSFEVGEQVRVADGPFASFNGVVEEVDEERSRLKVEVSIFGRAHAGRARIRSGRERSDPDRFRSCAAETKATAKAGNAVGGMVAGRQAPVNPNHGV
jgi:transcriptional antiterminator NusG